MERIELITSDQYAKTYIECIVTSKKSITVIRKELEDFFINWKNELVTHYTVTDAPIPRTNFDTIYDDENPDYFKQSQEEI